MRKQLAAALSLLLAVVLMSNSAFAATVYVLTGNNTLGAVNTTSPTVFIGGPAITGVAAGETLIGIDIRPQTQGLYALGVNATANIATLYHISPETGFAAAVGTAGQIAFTTDGATPLDLPDPNTVGWGFDFNPAADRVRVVAGGLTFRVNPNNGAPVDGDNGGAVGSVTGVNPDGPVAGGTTTVDAAAYTNSQPNTAATTLYTLDAASNSLFIQNPPNVGTQTLGQTVTFGGNTLDFTAINGFDIPAGVNAAANNAAVTSGSGFAVLNVGGTTGLYAINLVNAQATFIGNLGNGSTAIKGIAVRNNLGGGSAIALNAAATAIVRFNTATPGTSTTVSVGAAALGVGESLVGIDWRPQTGQLYGFAVNHTTNFASLYLIDPQTGALTVVGVQSGIGPSIDFPDPATASYGVDFNPAVDRLRITTTTGLNLRVNPNSGVLVQPDGAINGDGSTGVGEVAYTNNFGRDISVVGPTVLYTIDAAQDKLYIQNPPNSGTQTSPLPITLGGTPLALTTVKGFDIPSSNAANPEAWLAATVGGVDNLFKLDLSTGVATLAGATPTAIRGLVVFTTPIIEFSPFTGPINFGSVPLGGTVTRTVTVGSEGSQIVSYTASANGQYSVTQNATGSLGADTTIEVTLTATAAGPAAGQLTVVSSDPSMASVVFQLTGTVTNIPVITSGPTATPSTAGVGQTVAFSVAATHGDSAPLTFSWSIAGNTVTGANPTFVFDTTGIYTVTVTITDGLGGSATGSVNVTVVAPLVGTGNDTDGDGFSDNYETAAGTSPSNAADSPTAGVTPVIADLVEGKLIIKFNFAKPASDSIQFSGTLPIPAGFTAANKTAVIDVGGAIRSVTLDAKGKSPKGNSSFKVTIKSKKGVVAAQTAKYSVKLSKGDFDAQLADEGLVNADLKKVPASVLVRVIFGGTVYQKTQAVTYTAKAGKGGLAKETK